MSSSRLKTPIPSFLLMVRCIAVLGLRVAMQQQVVWGGELLLSNYSAVVAIFRRQATPPVSQEKPARGADLARSDVVLLASRSFFLSALPLLAQDGSPA